MDEWKEFSAKTVEDALTEAKIALGATSENIDYEVVEKESKGFLGIGSKPAKIRARKLILSVEDTARNFLQKVFRAMNVEISVEVEYDKPEETVKINLIGSEMGVLIGKRGQTLDSLQYLTSLVINKNSEGYLKVKLDTENYRERRKETLENLARNIASKVKRTRKPVSLEPMNPYERRIIHSALQADRYVETHSEGDEPFRKVVIAPKKNLREYDNSNGNGSYRGGYRNRYENGRYENNRYENGGVKKYTKKEFHKKYGGNTKDYSTDYKKDYAAYLEQKAAARAAAENSESAEAVKVENNNVSVENSQNTAVNNLVGENREGNTEE
ncbi:MAG: protein jag [Lachnospiraceae bacterium]|nr:protein jag [Lachnospiraceae bacterium]